MKAFAVLGAIGTLVLLGACTDQARVYALDPASAQAGTPKIQFVRQGLGHGPVTVTMPDGEILRGEYQVAQNAAVGLGFMGTHTFTTVGVGGGSPVVISASDDQGTMINCDGTADIAGHGFGECQTGKGAKYRVMF
jgi:hypothetical protein